MLLSCPQQPATCPYPKPDESSPHLHALFLKRRILLLFSQLCLSSKWSLSFRFPHQNPVSICLLLHTLHMPCPSHPPSFDHRNTIWCRLQHMKLNITSYNDSILSEGVEGRGHGIMCGTISAFRLKD